MRIVIDTNIILSAIIRDSITRHIIVSLGASFYYPEPSLDEIGRNKKEILEKGNLSEEEFKAILATLFKYITLVKTDELKEHMKKADLIIGAIHSNDVIFVAAALAKEAIIWSNDGHFQKQKEIPVRTTSEMIQGR